MQFVTRSAYSIALLIGAMLFSAGCRQNPFADREAVANKETLEKQQQYLAQVQELQHRANSLDANNSELHSQLARSRQNTTMLDKQLTALRQELKRTADDLALARQSQQQTDQRLQALQASTQRRGGAMITANSSRTRTLDAIEVPGATVRRDGDLVRIELPTDQLFIQGTATLHQQSLALLNPTIDAIQRHYPQQLIGIEAHADGTAPGGQWSSNHQLTSGQAVAVFDEFTRRYRMNPRRLLVVGQGANHPLDPSQTQVARTRNRRVEIVIYPETLGG